MSFAKFLKTPFFIKHLWWLLLGLCTMGFVVNWSSGVWTFKADETMSKKLFQPDFTFFFSYSIASLVVVNFRYKLVDQRMVNRRRTKTDSKLFLRVELVLFDTCLIIQESS